MLLVKEGQILISNVNSSKIEGHLEIYHKNRWGTISRHGFNFAAAKVACRQLGYAAVINYGIHYGSGFGPVWLTSLNCLGTELELTNCSIPKWGSVYNNHNWDVGVSCHNGNYNKNFYSVFE